MAVNETCKDDPYFYQACSSGFDLWLGQSRDLMSGKDTNDIRISIYYCNRNQFCAKFP